MNIKKFKATVVIEKEIEIEVNTDIISDKFLEEFGDSMWYVDCVEDIVEHVAFAAAHHDGYFIEGVGEFPKQWERDKNLIDQGVHIVSVEEDTNTNIDVEDV